MSITITLDAIFDSFGGISKPRRKFFIELFEILPCVRGRFNFTNIARFSHLNESTLRRNYSKFFDWMKFHVLFLSLFIFPNWGKDEMIASIDCSY